MMRHSGMTQTTGEDVSPFLIGFELTEGVLQVLPFALGQEQKCSKAQILSLRLVAFEEEQHRLLREVLD